jgi:AcrR family transcriptional regulator
MRGFSEAERERIRAALIDAGRELFARYGLGKTTIAELTDPAGIGTSTFYKFFDSKEALYLAVLAEEGEAIRERLADANVAELGPREGTVRFLELIMDEVETNPLVRTLIVEDELARLRAAHGESAVAADRREELATIRTFVEPWVEAGSIRGDPDPAVVAGAIRALTFLTLHEDDVGERYDEVRAFVIDTFARGLVADDGGA